MENKQVTNSDVNVVQVEKEEMVIIYPSQLLDFTNIKFKALL